ncbi:hypothetical protein C0J52_03393 [Blattella germanica]|nr:hypothetical protein C0J52_03393 [Blattella germanica]
MLLVFGIVDLQLPLLTRATAENDEPTAGYMLKEIEGILLLCIPVAFKYIMNLIAIETLTTFLDITFQAPPHCQPLAEYLNRKLEKPSSCVKLKVLKIMSYLIQNGHLSFRNCLRRNDGGVLDMLFHSDLLKQDDTQPVERVSLQLGGLGSTGNTKGKYEGFGSSPHDKEESVKDKMMDMLEKLVNPTDDTAEKIKSALTTHVPGRAGGGWESDDEIVEMPKSIIYQASMETNPARDIVVAFCSAQEWPLSPSQLNEVCKKCSSFNYADVLEVLSRQLLEQASDISLLRALLMLEWFVRTDLATPTAFSTIVSTPLDRASKSESNSEAVRLKAHKIQLILDKLQQR